MNTTEEEMQAQQEKTEAPAITAGTVIRTLVLILALVNQCLTAFGKSPLPFSDAEIQQAVTLIFTIAAAAVAWWENNSFTAAARVADETLKQAKADTSTASKQ